MSFIAKGLREQRYKLISDAQALIAGEDAGTQENMQTFDNMMAEADRLMSQIERVENASAKLEKVNEIISVASEKHKLPGDQVRDAVDTYINGMVAQMRVAANIPLSAQDKRNLEAFKNAAATTSAGAGGNFVPTELANEIFVAQVAQGGVLSAVQILRTAGGGPINWPAVDDTANIATIVAENTSVGVGTDLVSTAVTLGAYKLTSGVLLVSNELLQDSAFDFRQLVIDRINDRFIRAQNAFYTVGTGTGQPQGLITAAASGKVGATGQTTSVTYADLVDLEHSVTTPYRRGAKFMMTDAAFKSIKKLVDTQGRPLWLPSLAAGAPDSLLGYDIVVNPDMAVPAANAKSIVFGNFQNYIARIVKDLDIKVLNELYASTDQVGFVGIMRMDGRYIGNSNGLRYYANSAT